MEIRLSPLPLTVGIEKSCHSVTVTEAPERASELGADDGEREREREGCQGWLLLSTTSQEMRSINESLSSPGCQADKAGLRLS